jgi:hypothetical protein
LAKKGACQKKYEEETQYLLALLISKPTIILIPDPIHAHPVFNI